MVPKTIQVRVFMLDPRILGKLDWIEGHGFYQLMIRRSSPRIQSSISFDRRSVGERLRPVWRKLELLKLILGTSEAKDEVEPNAADTTHLGCADTKGIMTNVYPHKNICN